ncbi:MAG: biotin/lipoyl-binding protein [Ignavibacteriales bacterium]|nr:biotin/lipoyl-binding protein [Ignavibacteriales bacterium]
MKDSDYIISSAEVSHPVSFENNVITIGKDTHHIEIQQIDPHAISLIIDGAVFKARQIRVQRQSNGEVEVELIVNGTYQRLRIADKRAIILQSMLKSATVDHESMEIIAPMPGLVSKIEAAPGDRLDAGRGILILEAMKMENEIRSPISGTLRELKVRAGQNVEKNEILAVVSRT